MKKNASVKLCLVIVGCAAVYLYVRNTTSWQQTLPVVSSASESSFDGSAVETFEETAELTGTTAELTGTTAEPEVIQASAFTIATADDSAPMEMDQEDFDRDFQVSSQLSESESESDFEEFQANAFDDFDEVQIQSFDNEAIGTELEPAELIDPVTEPAPAMAPTTAETPAIEIGSNGSMRIRSPFFQPEDEITATLASVEKPDVQQMPAAELFDFEEADTANSSEASEMSAKLAESSVDQIPPMPIAPIASQPVAPQRLVSQSTAPQPVASDGEFLRPLRSPVRLSKGVQSKAIRHIEYGKSLARRGAVYGARKEFYSALRLIAQAVDHQTQTDDYSTGLQQALLALKEADDFYEAQQRATETVSVLSIAKHHKSKVLTQQQMESMKPIQAMQAYYNSIQKKFAVAGGKSVIAGEAMFCLGKLYLIQGKDLTDGDPLDNAKAIVHHRAALDCNHENYKSANELAVLLAQTGRMQQAKNLLIHGLKVRRVPQAWENLAHIHQQLGENDLAQKAIIEYQLMMDAPPTTHQITWVEPEAFAAQSAEPAALRTAMNPRRAGAEVNRPEKQSGLKKILNKVF